MSFDFTSEEGGEADVSVDKKDSDGSQKWIETMWVLFLGVLRFLPPQVVVNNLRLILTGWCMNLIDPPRQISSYLCVLCTASSGGQCLTLAQNWVSTSRPRKSNLHKICSEYLSSTCSEYLFWTLTFTAAHLCSALVQWQGVVNIECIFFFFLFAVTLWPLLSGYPLYLELKLQSLLWRTESEIFFRQHPFNVWRFYCQ